MFPTFPIQKPLKVHKSMKQPQTSISPVAKPDGTWAESNMEKADLFANHFSVMFKSNPTDNNYDIGLEVNEYLDSPNHLAMSP